MRIYSSATESMRFFIIHTCNLLQLRSPYAYASLANPREDWVEGHPPKEVVSIPYHHHLPLLMGLLKVQRIPLLVLILIIIMIKINNKGDDADLG